LYFYIKIDIGRKIIINYKIFILIKICIFSLLKKYPNNQWQKLNKILIKINFDF